MTRRDRRDRDRARCDRCGKTVTVRRDGQLMAHVDVDGRQCVSPAWQTRRATRCADCGEYGETTGHMGCQYPRDHA